MFEMRKFAVFSVLEIDKVDFAPVCEDSPATLRRSVDGSKTFVKWDEPDAPRFISTLATLEGPYTYAEMLTLLSGPEWTDPKGPMMPQPEGVNGDANQPHDG